MTLAIILVCVLWVPFGALVAGTADRLMLEKWQVGSSVSGICWAATLWPLTLALLIIGLTVNGCQWLYETASGKKVW